MKKILFVSLFILTFSLVTLAQQAPQFFGVKTDNGLAIIFNNGNKTFAFEVFGKEIKSADANSDGLLLIVDGKVLQLSFPKLGDVVGKAKITDEKEILKAHQTWELDFQGKNVFHQTITAENEDTIFLNLPKGTSRQTFFWTYKRPETIEKSEFNGDAFQTTVIGDRILVIGSPLVPNQDLRERRNYFNATLSTLAFFDKPISATQPKAPAKSKAKTTKTKGKN